MCEIPCSFPFSPLQGKVPLDNLAQPLTLETQFFSDDPIQGHSKHHSDMPSVPTAIPDHNEEQKNTDRFVTMQQWKTAWQQHSW